ncbi:alpha-mannosidase [Leeuwenhoekiella aestuarii]|uniref:Alpha-mannosidase n=1 Tax=Leeuwenhoekiella aestuarii TaxID=2249426 RepID=A0A4Q0NPD1_9FLAO|nr:glycoside hydrolase family 38 C-terminal domain-containing protein [Leeuwenhoekiella aestuarii]RXG11549.1 alpha-mannosidase [Leeuwenhoekiella aestuarii]RXG12066.1 alpha-mannosidase [Leeuwenhoekiella aestuarii]
MNLDQFFSNCKLSVFLAFLIRFSIPAVAQENSRSYDLTKDRIVYTVGYAHLDTEWNWDYPTVVNEYIKNILTENFYLFKKYPNYRFNFTGSRRYKMMKEYYPELYEELKKYIANGKWFVAGSSVDEAETVISSPESIIRQTLYGNNFFQSEFDKKSNDYMLPDCFGFPSSLPTILNHSGLIGFSTQKLSWGSAVGVPFNVGTWYGPDGNGIVSALNAGAYVSHIPDRFDLDKGWNKRLDKNKKNTGYAFDYRYYGVGDQGGAPRENDVVHAEESLNNADSNFKVVLSSSDQMFKDIIPEIKKNLPTYKGDLLLTEHSAGSITSKAFMKKMNRKNELLAKAAEPLAVIADWKKQATYPFSKINAAWELVLSNQMHDILPGTSIPSVYEYAWNDELIAANSFSNVLKHSLKQVTADMDTRGKGRSVIVYNPVEKKREGIVTATLAYKKVPQTILVYEPSGKPVKTQIISKTQDSISFIFEVNIPSMGIKVYDVRDSKSNIQENPDLNVKTNMLENEHYKVELNSTGDITQLYDKNLNKSLLKYPTRLDFQSEKSFTWPAWNMLWDERQKPPFATMSDSVEMKIVEKGPLRVAIEVTRYAQNSILKQTLSLASGAAGKRLEINNVLDWQATGVSLKAAFPLTAVNDNTTYSWGVGTIERGVNSEKKYEVPSKQWFDQTDESNEFGISILEDSKYGSDKPDPETLRLTLMFTPETDKRYIFQKSQDWGVHEFNYGLYAHSGNWQEGRTPWQGKFFNQPLMAFESSKHKGRAGKEISILHIDNDGIGLMAFKKMENSSYYLIRVNELLGRDQNGVNITLPATVVDAYEVNGQEERLGQVDFAQNQIKFDLKHYGIKAFAVKFSSIAPKEVSKQLSIALPYNSDAFSFDTNRNDGNLEDKYSIPAELIPARIVHEDVIFKMGPTADRSDNVLISKGQQIQLPEGAYNTLYVLAAATKETQGDFVIDGEVNTLKIQDWTGKIGQFYKREFAVDRVEHKDTEERVAVKGIQSPYLKTSSIAWFATHRHLGYPSANKAYEYSYLYAYKLKLSKNAKKLTLPDNESIRIFAITAVDESTVDLETLSPISEDFNYAKKVELRN